MVQLYTTVRRNCMTQRQNWYGLITVHFFCRMFGISTWNSDRHGYRGCSLAHTQRRPDRQTHSVMPWEDISACKKTRPAVEH